MSGIEIAFLIPWQMHTVFNLSRTCTSQTALRTNSFLDTIVPLRTIEAHNGSGASWILVVVESLLVELIMPPLSATRARVCIDVHR